MNLGIYNRGMDYETRTVIDMLDQGRFGRMDPREYKIFTQRVMERIAMVEAGSRMTPDHWNARLHEIDENLRIRWDFDHRCWAVERWVVQFQAWAILKYWEDDAGAAPMDIPWLCHILTKGDMQRNANHWQERRDQASIIRQANAKRGTDMIAAAVDSLSNAQVANFIAVEKARHTREKIVHHGGDQKFVERVAHNTRTGKSRPVRNKSYNPGHRYDRVSRGLRDSQGVPLGEGG